MAIRSTGPNVTDSLANADGAPLAANLVGGMESDRNAGAEKGKHAGGGYSRFVKLMKVLLPFFALGLIALVVAWPRLKSDDTFRIGFASVDFTGNAEPGMDNARYVGTDENRQPYSVTADLARMVGDDNGIVDLELPKADLTLEDGTWLVLTANSGRYSRADASLDLVGGVNLYHDTGYEISTEKLRVDLNVGSAEGRTPLSGHGPFGELKAQGIKLIDKGRVIYFTGPAQVILYASPAEE